MTAGEEKEGYQPDPKEIEAVESLSRQVQRGEERIAFGKKIKAKIEEQKQNKQREEQERIAAISKNITSFEQSCFWFITPAKSYFHKAIRLAVADYTFEHMCSTAIV